MLTRRFSKLFVTLVGSLFAAQAFAAAEEWALDASHTHVGFTVPHMMVSEVDGEFRKFSGKVLLDDKDVTKSEVELTIDANSIDTGDEKRDKHLRDPDFFDVAKHPNVTFKSTKISKAGKGYKIKGLLTIRGVTKEVTLDAMLSEPVVSPWGKTVRAAKLTGKVNRKDFGLNWNKSLDQGGLVLGDEVTLSIKAEVTK